MRKSKYSEWTKEELVKRVEALEKRKKYGLVWDEEKTKEKFEAEAEGKFPVLKAIKSKEIKTDPEKPTHILIEGDNYHALSVLNYTHEKEIDVIYIDPPFNTGNNSWRYNNSFIEKDDAFKHSKWLTFMYKRLLLAKRLLKKDGTIIIAIDDYEVHHLGLLIEEIFYNYEIDLIIVEHHPQGAGSNTVSRTHEYAFICTPKNIGFKGREIREEENTWSLKRSGQGENNWRINRPKQFFAILVDEKKREVVGVGPELTKDEKYDNKKYTDDGLFQIYPIDKEGKERVWRYHRPTMLKLIKEKKILYTIKNSLVVKKDNVNAVPVFSIWKGSKYNAGTHGSTLLTRIMGRANTFPYPKSIYTVTDLLNLIIRNDKKAIILDFFAGSGTTAQAVLEINLNDDGKRQFILCTNNENNICDEVCYPRIKKVINGYKYSGIEKKIIFEKKISYKDLEDADIVLEKVQGIIEKYSDGLPEIKIEDGLLQITIATEANGTVKGLGGNLKYFKTAFVPQEPTDKNRELLTKEAEEMLCLRENAFELILEKTEYKIYKNSKKYLGIVWDQIAIDAFKKEASKYDKNISVYVFSLTDEDFSNEFADMKRKIKVCSIPEAILRVYRRIFTE